MSDFEIHKTSLRQRVRQFYRHFNRGHWKRCFHFVDPDLRKRKRIALGRYRSSLSDFKERYGQIEVLFLKAGRVIKVERGEARAFAYVLVLWQDKDHAYHLFRERWIQDEGEWYTRVVGLVAHDQNGQHETR